MQPAAHLLLLRLGEVLEGLCPQLGGHARQRLELVEVGAQGLCGTNEMQGYSRAHTGRECLKKANYAACAVHPRRDNRRLGKYRGWNKRLSHNEAIRL